MAAFPPKPATEAPPAPVTFDFAGYPEESIIAPINLPHQGGFQQGEMAQVIIKRRMRRFMQKHGNGFKEWWKSKDYDYREWFILDVYPGMVHSKEDPWTYTHASHQLLERSGDLSNKSKLEKTSHKRYNQIMALFPDKFTFGWLTKDDNLLTAIDEFCVDDALAVMLYDTFQNYRHLMSKGEWLWYTPAQREMQKLILRPQKGNLLKIILPTGTLDEGIDSDENIKFLSNYIQLKDPATLLTGTGTIGPDGKPVNIYLDGGMGHKFEVDIVLAHITTVQHMIAALLDEYAEEILEIEYKDVPEMPVQCMRNACGSRGEDDDPRNLNRCGGCSFVYYCSKECQQADWKTHKKLCRAVREKKKVAGVNTWK